MKNIVMEKTLQQQLNDAEAKVQASQSRDVVAKYVFLTQPIVDLAMLQSKIIALLINEAELKQ